MRLFSWIPVAWLTIRNFLDWPSHARRLEAEILAFDSYLDRVMQAENPPEWCKSARKAVAEARGALPLRLFGEAMIAFDYAKREEILTWKDDEVRVHAILLSHQSERLDEVARNAIKEVLKSKAELISAAELATLTELRDRDFQGTFFKMERFSRHLSQLSWATFFILLGVATLAKFHILFGCPPEVLLGVIVFGALGASLSMMLSIAPSPGGPIPSQLATGVLLYARPLFGASAAVAVYTLVRMGALNIPYNSNTGNNFEFFGFAFVSGFSDQLLLSAVGKVVTNASHSHSRKDHSQ